MNKKELIKQITALEILIKEVPFKYPKGSSISIAPHNPLYSPDNRYRCISYNMVGGDYSPANFVDYPKEWQDLSIEEVDSIAAMFDLPFVWLGIE